MALVATSPEPARARVVLIRTPGNRLVEAAHEPRKATHTLTTDGHAFGVAEQGLFLGSTGLGIDLSVDRGRKQSKNVVRFT